MTAPILISGLLELSRQGCKTRGRPARLRLRGISDLAAHRLPWREDLWEQAGSEALLAQKPEEAIRLLERAPALSAAGWMALGQAYRQTGNWNGALGCLSGGFTTEPLPPRPTSAWLEIHRHNGDCRGRTRRVAEPASLSQGMQPPSIGWALLSLSVTT